ncbi:CRISPR-associated endoribonuclease Cas6 [Thioflexithrix psekupsensis]|uniref:CRISPR associated protein Cas6 C-terminal domain-containing protein n=1 Tax=Thioflexithrix psekupsensis TaxID=1570016 RepID=A0A251X6V7_9GAMM|nr:CRISPR-associated endoribonuclease Cas6 [Thioflexithrix psekupsensis]OUD13070.1 hypothetical protein TPSD3_10490 [Thioflexithrix psekupsensis]
MTGIRLYIDIPHDYRHAVIQHRDSVANVLTRALRRHGWQPTKNQPARWGFGVITKPVNKTDNPKQRLYKLQRVIVGSSDPEIAAALAQINADDLMEDTQAPGAGLDFSVAEIYSAPDWVETEAVNFYCVSPIRVSDPEHKIDTYLQTDDRFNLLLNRTMQTRFQRPFHLKFTPDNLYTRLHDGDITGHMAIKMKKGQPVILQGIIVPFLLTGPAEDLRDVWFSGLGRSSARGFGCVELAQ